MPYRTQSRDVNESIEKAVESLDLEDPELKSYVRQIMVTGGKLSQDDATALDMKIITNSMKEIRYAFQVFRDYRERQKISVFGSARTGPEQQTYRDAETFARLSAEDDYMLISGAGPGIMEAVNKGAGAENSFGLHITLPFEDQPNRYIRGDEKCIHFRYFFSRKLIFAKEANAVVIFPGGMGTHDEFLELMTLLQTGRQHLLPIILIDRDGFWQDFISYLTENLIEAGTISSTDMNLFEYVQKPEEALASINTFYSNYHSSRYVGEHFVIRFWNPPNSEQKRSLQEDFKDLCPESGFQLQKDPVNGADDDLPEQLYRLVFQFTSKDFGRLRKLIDFMNTWSENRTD